MGRYGRYLVEEAITQPPLILRRYDKKMSKKFERSLPRSEATVVNYLLILQSFGGNNGRDFIRQVQVLLYLDCFPPFAKW